MVKNFAHRGFSGKYPENTMIAFEKALEIGVDGIEFDVQMTKDNQLVIIHDETIDRTSNGTGYVKDFTYEELLEYDFSAEYKGVFGKIQIPLLRDYFKLAKDANIITNIELKNSVFDYENIEQITYDLIKEFNLKDQVMISSFNHESLLRMKNIDANITCGFLADCWILGATEYTKRFGIDCYHPSGYSLTKEKVNEMHENGIKVNAWLLSKYPMDYKTLIDLGIDGLISDNPDIIKNLINK